MNSKPLVRITRCSLDQLFDLPLTALSQTWDGKIAGKSLQWSLGYSDHTFFVRSRWEKPVCRALGENGSFQLGLWKGDVLEFFLGTRDSQAYLEFNFSPTGAWSVCRFIAQREPDQAWKTPYTVDCEREESGYAIDIVWSISPAPLELFASGEALANVTGVKVNVGGELDYLSWTTPPEGPPDFHLPELRRNIDFRSAPESKVPPLTQSDESETEFSPTQRDPQKIVH